MARESGLRGADPVKTTKLIVWFSIALFASLSAQAQGTFQNLDFESATPSAPIMGPLGPFYQPEGLALPGWNAYLGITQQSEVLQNLYAAGAGSVDIFGPNYTAAGPQGDNPGIIDGKYTVFLQAGAPGPTEGNASIEQNGTIPSGAQSIEWKAWDYNPSSSFLSVSFGGNVLSPVVLGSGANYTLYGADISAFAGQTGELEFTSVFSYSGPSWIELDDISFSTNSVSPEPSIVALTAIGGLLFGARKWFARR